MIIRWKVVFFSYITCDTTWAFIEPEKLIADYPLAFHQSEKEKFKKVCMELGLDEPQQEEYLPWLQ